MGIGTILYKQPRLAVIMQSRVEYIRVSEDMLINPTSEGFLKRMLGQRSGILVCACPNELDGREVLKILANHSIRLSLGYMLYPEGDTYNDGAADERISRKDANDLSRAYLSRKPDYRFFERRIDNKVFAEMVQTAMSEGLLATGYIPAPSSFSALSKLLEITSTRTVIASILNGVFAINYINIICPHCREELPPSDDMHGLALTGEMDGANLRQFKGAGCPNCDGTGFIGHEVISECLDINADIREAIIHGAGESAIKRLGKSAGTTTFLDTAWAFFRAGITTLDEVKRIAEATR